MRAISRFRWKLAMSEIEVWADPHTPSICVAMARDLIVDILPGVEVKQCIASGLHQIRWHGRIIDERQEEAL